MDRTLRTLLFILVTKATLLALFVLSGALPLAPDEAQYWLWSRALDWGYYSKPPGVAWQIAAGTALFGDTEFGVRFMAILLGHALPLFLYRLIVKSGVRKEAALWAALAFSFAPVGVLVSTLSTTDCGFLLFWTLAAVYACEQQPKLYRVAFLIAAGALFKWPIYLLWVPLLLLHRSRRLLGAMMLSLAGLAPSLIWNWAHDWATFRHVGMTMAGRPSETKPFIDGNPLEFLGAQLGIYSPLLFALLCLGLCQLWRRRQELEFPLRFSALTTSLFLVLYLLLSVKQKMQGNWAIFVYPTATVIVAWVCQQRIIWLKMATAMAALLTSIILFLPILQKNNIEIAKIRPSYKLNVLRHNLGWDALPSLLVEAGYNPKQHFLFGDRYQSSCALSFYSPNQNRAYFFNLQNMRKNQFSYWPSMALERVGQTGYYLLTEHEPHYSRDREKLIAKRIAHLSPYFSNVSVAAEGPLFTSYGDPAKQALLLRCEQFKGGAPTDPEVY